MKSSKEILPLSLLFKHKETGNVVRMITLYDLIKYGVDQTDLLTKERHPQSFTYAGMSFKLISAEELTYSVSIGYALDLPIGKNNCVAFFDKPVIFDLASFYQDYEQVLEPLPGVKYVTLPEPVNILTYDKFVEYGKENALIIRGDGFPTMFYFLGRKVIAHSNEAFNMPAVLTGTDMIRFHRGSVLVVHEHGKLSTCVESNVLNLFQRAPKPEIHMHEVPSAGARKVDLGFAPHEVGDEIKRRAAHLIEFLEAHSEMDPDRIKRASDKIEEACMLAVRAVSRKKN